jgi:hypothetical protein
VFFTVLKALVEGATALKVSSEVSQQLTAQQCHDSSASWQPRRGYMLLHSSVKKSSGGGCGAVSKQHGACAAALFS